MASSMNEAQLRDSMVEIGRLMYQKGWVASNDGNLSVRLDEERVLCTPTAISKGRMQPADMVICDLQGKKLEGQRAVTSEILMHLTYYRLRPDVRAVVHAHPPVSTGFAVAGRALNQAILPEVVVNLGAVPLAEYGLPGTPELGESIEPFIPSYDAILLSNHGVVCAGTEIWEAFSRMETVEHVARISMVAEVMGGARALPREEVKRLFAARARYGISSKNSLETACLLTREDLEGQEKPPALQSSLATQPSLAALLEENAGPLR